MSALGTLLVDKHRLVIMQGHGRSLCIPFPTVRLSVCLGLQVDYADYERKGLGFDLVWKCLIALVPSLLPD